ncbi:uncharacterized protein LOC115825116 [Chanos chanos]|uniref:Uncharacterized protein LOC115825116 n=1 Tax=Chanos chanos TaxID=29144 RepID=A0A6J2WMA5_CHACN|nr:uncharacterized protein LOC115825116 [Chanos chanos]
MSSSKSEAIKRDFSSLPDPTRGSTVDYLKTVADLVSKYRKEKITLKKVEKYKFIIGNVEDTAYGDDTDEAEEWEQFYLPDHVKMEVIGALEHFPCNGESAQLVLMVCEDGKVYGYEEEYLHLVADSPKDLFDSGVQFPGKKSFYRGQSFENMTKADWNEVKQSPEMQEMYEEHKRLVQSYKHSYLSNLRGAAGSDHGQDMTAKPVPVPVRD